MKPPLVRHPAINRSLRFLIRNWHRPIKVADLARVSALSRRGFLKAFLKHTNIHPSDELQRLRLNHAQLLLTETDFSLLKISRLCGYRSLNSFWVAFRRLHRQSPQQYRAQVALQSIAPAPPTRARIEVYSPALRATQRLISKLLCVIYGMPRPLRLLGFQSQPCNPPTPNVVPPSRLSNS